VQLAQKLAARLKVMSRLDIAERRVPQDGRIKMRLSKNRAIDFRVSTCPTLFGEKIVMRILDPAQASLGIDSLGYEPFQKALYEKYLAKPQGMILVTGPTGSGKTVSLYTGLHILNREDTNISTAEDPGTSLPGVNQVNGTTRWAPPSRPPCAPSCARTLTSSWSVRSVTWKRPRSRSRPRSRATWSSPRCTPTTRPPRSRAW
jgi:type IV pilus assembly protein PilB